jgi:hypothetical protein
MQELTAMGPKQSFAIEQVERSEILHGAQIFIVQPGRVSQRRFVRLRKSLHGLRRKNGSNGGQIEQGGAPMATRQAHMPECPFFRELLAMLGCLQLRATTLWVDSRSLHSVCSLTVALDWIVGLRRSWPEDEEGMQ